MRSVLLWSVSLILVLLCWSPRLGSANPRESAAAAAPFVEEQTIAVARVDLARVDVAATWRRLSDLLPAERLAQPFSQNTQELRQAAQAFQEAGGELYVVLNLADWPAPGPFFVVKSAANPAVVNEALAYLKTETRELIGGAWFCGSAGQLRRIQQGPTAPRPELAAAFEAAGDTAAQCLLIPAADHRRVMAEMLPRLPDELGGGDGRALAAIQWIAAGINLSPEATLNVSIQATDEPTALEVKSTLASLGFTLSRMAAVREVVPGIDDLATAIMPRLAGNRLSITLRESDGSLPKLLSALSAPLGAAQAHAARSLSTNNLKQLALAMHIYHDRHHRFPPAASRGAEGMPLLSWRVHLLPFLDQQQLYEQFHLDEPWDSEHNRKLVAQMPGMFAGANAKLQAEGRTTYLLPTGRTTVFPSPESLRIRDIRDGTSNTVMIVAVPAERAVIWTKPEDVTIEADQPLPGLVELNGKDFLTAFCDGSVRALPHDLPEATLRLLFDPNDGQPIPRF